MPDASYLACALGVAVLITFTLRALPFSAKRALAGSAMVADIGRWMPLGAVAILTVYCLSKIDVTAASHGVPQIAGVAVTVAVHGWRRNALLSILCGTATCVVLTAVM